MKFHPNNKNISLTDDQKKDLQRLMSQVTCDRCFDCVKHKLNSVCYSKRLAGQDLLICLEEKGPRCHYYQIVDDQGVCGCPMRKVAARVISN